MITGKSLSLMESLVITIIGKDRPGLVESVSAAVDSHGGSWVESRMARLSGHFAGILRASVPEAQTEALSKSLSALVSEGLQVTVERGFASDVQDANVVLLELIGSDRPGIVYKISEALAAKGVNVDELDTECDGAPWSGDALFKARARLHAPKGLDLEELREGLEAIAGDLMVDITLGAPD
ncbi:MAG: ACT domain-containing protein [Myxococcota bacterium]